MHRFLALFLSSAWAMAQLPAVQENALRAHLAFLASDLLEGRGMGQRGGNLAVAYLETQMKALGLKPAHGASFLQQVDLVRTTLNRDKSHIRFANGLKALEPQFLEDVVYTNGTIEPSLDLEAKVLFCGFGIQSAKDRWDDFKGQDCRGKLLIFLAGEPASTPSEPDLFEGPSLSIHGRWDKKFEMAALQGAAGVLIVHTTAGAAYDWSVVKTSFQNERYMLAEGSRGTSIQGWMHETWADRLFNLTRVSLKDLQRQAQTRTFHPIPLDLVVKGHLESNILRFPQFNIAGILPGTDPELGQELVIYSAHWDHFGIQDGRIFNGAVDNASGCAGVLALAQASISVPTRRSQMFLLFCGEETGLLGSRAYVQAPLWPLNRTVAVLNLETLNWVGPSLDIDFLGGERSTLLELGEAAGKEMNLSLRPQEPDLAGLSFRSDHFPFVKAGVPAVSPGFSLSGQRTYLGAQKASKAKANSFLQRYHQESDDYDPSWDMRGMIQQTQFILNLGRLIAMRDDRPRWK